MTEETADLLRTIATGAVVVVCQAYNTWKHEQTVARLTATENTTNDNFDALRDDLAAARAAIERLSVTVNGADRRRAPAPLSGRDADAAQAAGFGKRWNDPRPANLPAE